MGLSFRGRKKWHETVSAPVTNGSGLAGHVAGDSGRGHVGSGMPEGDYLRTVDQNLYYKFRPPEMAARLTNLDSGLLGTGQPSATALYAAYGRVGCVRRPD